MHFNRFTEEQVNKLKANQYVDSVTDKRIIYSQEFKDLFIERYQQGVEPRQIFKESGFDVNALGYKRIERASSRWRTAYNDSLDAEDTNYVEVHTRRKRQTTDVRSKILEQAEVIKKLQDENEELKKKLERFSSGL